MKEEILAAVMFLVRFIEKSETFPRDQLENFKNNLTTLLTQRFEKHWFPDLPAKGQGYRCIRVNGVNPVDMTLEKAAILCGLSYRDLRLPTELTVWVDPSEVCYRLGESEGSYCTLATFPSDSAPSSPNCDRQKKVTNIRTRFDGFIKDRHHHNHSIHHGYPHRTQQRSDHSTSSYLSSPSALRHVRQVAGSISASQWRCTDRQHLPIQPHHTHPYHYPSTNRYNHMSHHRNYKNVVTV